MVHKDINWRRRVDMEIQSQRQFPTEHGYMLAYTNRGRRPGQGGPAPPDSLDAFASSSKALAASYDGNLSSIYNMRASRPRLGGSVDSIVGLRALEAPAKRLAAGGRGDSVEDFLEAYLKRAPGVPK